MRRLSVPRLLGLIAIPVSLAAMLVILRYGSDRQLVRPYLLITGNFLFLALTYGYVAFLTARSFLARPRLGVLLLGSGALMWSLGASETLVAIHDANDQITIYNFCVFTSALLHLVGMLPWGQRQIGPALLWLTAALAGCLAIVALVSVAAIQDVTPDFYIPGTGPTLVRQAVLGAAILMTGVASALLFARQRASAVAEWYALALALASVGLFGVWMPSVHNNLMNWVGRFAQWLSGVCMLVAAIRSADETHAWELSIEAALKVATQRTEALLERISDGFLAFDRDWRFAYLNPAAERMIGARRNLIGRHYLDVFPQARERRFAAEYERAAREQITVEFEEYYPEPLNGWFACRAYPGPDGVTVLFRNVTAERAAREELARTQAALKAHAENLEKVVEARTAELRKTIEDLEQFSYAVAHDMRAPLRTMTGFADIVLEESKAGEYANLASHLQRIRNAASRMDKLISGALDYSRAGRLAPSLDPIALDRVIASVIEMSPNLQPEAADIECRGELPIVRGNESALIQCFSNVLGNAVKFVHPGQRPRVIITAERNHGTVRVWVEDNGIGITQRSAEKLFRLFERGAPGYEGTGIGLAVARRLVESMGGAMGVESDGQNGSRFWIELALADAR